MATRQSEEEKIIAWFTAADPEAAKVMFRVLKGLIVSRGIETGRKQKAAPKKTATKKPAPVSTEGPGPGSGSAFGVGA